MAPWGKEVEFDACLAKELFSLWDKGIRTTGCCCGMHANSKANSGYIGVLESDINRMKMLGYMVKYNKMRPEAEDSFYLKTFVRSTIELTNTRSPKTLKRFIKYCNANPNLRFFKPFKSFLKLLFLRLMVKMYFIMKIIRKD